MTKMLAQPLGDISSHIAAASVAESWPADRISDGPARAVPLSASRSQSYHEVASQAVSVTMWLGDLLAIQVAKIVIGLVWTAGSLDRMQLIAIVCYTGIARVTGAYDFDALIYFKRAWPRVANAWLTSVIAIAAVGVALNVQAGPPLLHLATWIVAGLFALAVARAALILFTRRLKRRGAFDRRTAIVGTGEQGIGLVEHVAGNEELAVRLVGFFDDRPIGSALATSLPLPFHGGIPDLVAAIRAGAIDKVFIAVPWSDEARLRAVMEVLSATPVEIRLAPDKAGFAYARKRVTSIAGLSVITLLEQPLSGPQQLQKATEDRLLALLALIFLLPLMLAVALAIKLTSPGPVLFRQPREGFNCQSFDILKFRTMHYGRGGDCRAAEIVQASRCDPRITRLGAWLRRTSIDELPQLVNVLFGHMSLVGPRPHAAATRAGGKLFADVAATYAARHKVKPGLTGWAQVCGWRGETDTEEKLIRRLEHDMYYVEHWSIWFDFYILVRTALTVLGQRTAY